MSYQSSSEIEIENAVKDEVDSGNSFEHHIIQCCKATEWDLRKWLKKVLVRAGFQIFEDGYRTERANKDKRYETVHNMLAIRGNPDVCLVAHSDVCRDHGEMGAMSSYGDNENHYWMYDRKDEDISKPKIARKVEPVIKTVEMEGGGTRRIIQDKDCRLQVGGDDRLGIAINTWIALNSGFDLALFVPTDEEIGLKSSRACEMQQLKDFSLLVQNRGNHSNELVIKIGNEILCSYENAVRLLEIAYDIGLPRTVVNGASTDVAALKAKGLARQAVNMTCGYHSSVGASANEWIDIQESKDTLKYVASIVKDFYLNGAG